MKEQTWTFLITELAEQHTLIRSATEMQHKILQFYFVFITALTGVIIYILEKNLPLIEIREDLCYLLGVIVFLTEIYKLDTECVKFQLHFGNQKTWLSVFT